LRQRGSIFVLTIAVLAGLVAILASVAATHQLYVNAEASRLESARARMAAMSAIEHTMEELYAESQAQANPTSTGTSGTPSQAGAKTLNDDWAQFGSFGDEKFTIGNASFRVQMVDTASMINLNTATEAQLQRLPLTQDLIDCLLDFREPGQTARPQGAKDDYYNQLSQGYNTKLRGFDTYDELLQVKGFTPNILYYPQTDVVSSAQVTTTTDTGDVPPLSDICTVYSYSPELNPLGQAKINVNGGDAATKLPRLLQIGISPVAATTIASQNWTSLGTMMQRIPGLTPDQQKTILDNCTTSAAPRVAGKINLNTAKEAVLNSVPGMTSDIAQAIIQQQSQGFTSLGDILNVPGITGDALQMVDYFTVGSQTFLVRAIGTSGNTSVPIEAIIDIQNSQPKIIQITDPPYPDYLTRWGWQDDSSTETVLKDSK
jgi:DNA uptake protein ComE-like DNA-binding protein